jgi:hypothetical protein
MALRLMKTTLPRPELTETDAIAIVQYHLQRNHIARKAHVKSWHKRHKKGIFKVLL